MDDFVKTGPRLRISTLIIIRDGMNCHWCGVETRKAGGGSPWNFTVEHIIPRSKGGTNDLSNLVGAHQFCNNVRGTIAADRFPDSWRAVLREVFESNPVTYNDCYVWFGEIRRERNCVRF